ncbi:HD domain-containing protein [candidate division KSB1 bacterium]|nr:HD domain-containing protein [candidate division KSB1 bacterium]
MIKDLKPGDKFVAFFILRKKAIRTKFNSDEIYLSLELGDASQRINGTVWEKPQEVYEAIELGDIMKVKATAIHFKDKLHLNIEKIRKAEESDEFDIKELVPVVDKDRDALLSHLDELIASVENSYLKELLKLVFTDSEIRQQFKDAPGGKLWHHNYLGGLLEHTLSVTDIADRVGQMYPNIKRDLIIAAGLLHDIGKIWIPDDILNKPGRLSAREFDVIKQHPLLGHGLLRRAGSLDEEVAIIATHHERLDGAGYPYGLSAAEILIEARIIAVADVYDSLATDRPHRSAFAREDVHRILKEEAGAHLDPGLVEIWLSIAGDYEELLAAQSDRSARPLGTEPLRAS